LRSVTPADPRAYYGLLAELIRRELLDQARRFSGGRYAGESVAGVEPLDRSDAGADDGDLDRWRSFHQAVETLPVEEREVVGLTFYHQWSHSRIAELLGISERTVRRYWQSACDRLRGQAGRDQSPGA
jgi:RNA polymerase sigma factor (sigma-70 family)